METLSTETDVSKQLRVTAAALRRWRLERRGPQFVKVGRLVRYPQADVEAWLSAQPTGGAQSRTRPAPAPLAAITKTV
jgi:predicted DNA-binding transcriptional regulator AlpA